MVPAPDKRGAAVTPLEWYVKLRDQEHREETLHLLSAHNWWWRANWLGRPAGAPGRELPRRNHALSTHTPVLTPLGGRR